MKYLVGFRRQAVQWSSMLLSVFVLLLSTGCFYNIRFEDIGYSIEQKKFDAGLVAVITPQTVAQGKQIQSLMAGPAYTWEARPGEMLLQIAEVEFPQMFQYYRTAIEYQEPKEGDKRLIVELLAQHYDFSDFHATVVVQAKTYHPGHVLIFDKSYREEGDTQGGKMFWGGPFAMKSAIRQSSFDAYKKVFAKLRTDLVNVLETPAP